MKRIVTAAFLSCLLPLAALADNVGGCGLGSKLFDGQKGVIPQIFAVTTNGSTGNQTFGISSGTSGCSQDGVVKTSWRTAAFIDSNMNRLALDISRGQGESLDSLASLTGVQAADQAAFAAALQSNFSQIFASADITSAQVTASIKNVLAQDARLAAYSANV